MAHGSGERSRTRTAASASTVARLPVSLESADVRAVRVTAAEIDVRIVGRGETSSAAGPSVRRRRHAGGDGAAASGRRRRRRAATRRPEIMYDVSSTSPTCPRFASLARACRRARRAVRRTRRRQRRACRPGQRRRGRVEEVRTAMARSGRRHSSVDGRPLRVRHVHTAAAPASAATASLRLGSRPHRGLTVEMVSGLQPWRWQRACRLSPCTQ